jgi:hypothetical protein
VKCKWVYKTKFTLDGDVERHKALLVKNVFYQHECINYIKTFSPIDKMNSV